MLAILQSPFVLHLWQMNVQIVKKPLQYEDE